MVAERLVAASVAMEGDREPTWMYLRRPRQASPWPFGRSLLERMAAAISRALRLGGAVKSMQMRHPIVCTRPCLRARHSNALRPVEVVDMLAILGLRVFGALNQLNDPEL